MATLTLPPGTKRKPKPEAVIQVSEPARESTKIHDLPTECLTGKFAVMRQWESKAGMRFTCLHDTLELATSEANRLAGEHTSPHLFLVLHVVATVVVA